MVRKSFVIGWLVILLFVIGAVFWYNDWQYQLPTPVPSNYKPVAHGERVSFNSRIRSQSNKPLFLHFYNPECPCSRFNKKHFQSLVRKYEKKIEFVVVVLSEKHFTREYIQQKIGLDIPVTFDESIAKRCGVYSTPQAALIDNQDKLYYRGNYNASRYCTEEKTAFARMAIDGLLDSETLQVMNAKALKSYGCTIPLCKN